MEDMTIERWQDPAAPGVQQVRLAGSMTIAQASELRDALLGALQGAGQLRLDLSGITEIDLTGVQLLGATHRSARASGKKINIQHGGNQVYLDTLSGAGFKRCSGCDEDTKHTCIWVGGND
jgi:ABC-type transporter Mla MlaB component